MHINWVDILIVIFIVMSVIWGKKRGFSEELIALIVTLLSWVLAFHFYKSFASKINSWFMLSMPTSLALAFIILVVVVFSLGSFICKLLKKVMELSFTGNIETIGGCITGGVRGCIVITIAIVSLILIPKDYLRREFCDNSLIGGYLVSFNTRLCSWIWSDAEKI